MSLAALRVHCVLQGPHTGRNSASQRDFLVFKSRQIVDKTFETKYSLIILSKAYIVASVAQVRTRRKKACYLYHYCITNKSHAR